MEKYLLCRPEGGLNDILNQIEICCEYAAKFDRTVIVDTYSKAWSFRDKFSNYFVSKQQRLILSRPLDFDVPSYEIEWSDSVNNFVNAATKQRVTFDFNKDYSEEVLLHHDCGGGIKSLNALTRMRLQNSLIDILNKRLETIGDLYSAFHIRNTDYQTNYRNFVWEKAMEIVGPIFVATDSYATLMDCKDIISVTGEHQVFSFADLPTHGKPLHTPEGFNAGLSVNNNRDAILDLIMLAMSDRLYIQPLKAITSYSGFSILANNLHMSKSSTGSTVLSDLITEG
jgi:hypothetical protein